jgi:hypothetical protein
MKVTEYLQAGVPLVWVFYPDTRTVSVYRAGGKVARLGVGETLSDHSPTTSIPPGYVEEGAFYVAALVKMSLANSGGERFCDRPCSSDGCLRYDGSSPSCRSRSNHVLEQEASDVPACFTQ